ncbi:MAG: 30S ribosomal protein S16 [Gammaproteobacteria bacterium]|nr:30S ribosomal protein S16 [Gammaproteobacteria bacterium]
MVRLRLALRGRKKAPQYHLVAADQKSPRDGRFLEVLGTYNPSPRGQQKLLDFNLSRIDYWISCGAQCSDSVRTLVKKFRNIQSKVTVAE